MVPAFVVERNSPGYERIPLKDLQAAPRSLICEKYGLRFEDEGRLNARAVEQPVLDAGSDLKMVAIVGNACQEDVIGGLSEDSVSRL